VGVEPFCNGPVAWEPTATHAVAAEHETPSRTLRPDHAPDNGVTDHVEPFHISAKGTDESDWPPLEPTATQSEVETQLTPFKSAYVAPVGSGEGTIDQDDPFQLSTKVDPPAVPPALLPTAMQNDAPTHATPLKVTSSALGGLGLGLVVQMGAARPEAEANVAGAPIMPRGRVTTTPNSTTSRITLVRTFAYCRRQSVLDRGQCPPFIGQDCPISRRLPHTTHGH
jgi:hypothetical protein